MVYIHVSHYFGNFDFRESLVLCGFASIIPPTHPPHTHTHVVFAHNGHYFGNGCLKEVLSVRKFFSKEDPHVVVKSIAVCTRLWPQIWRLGQMAVKPSVGHPGFMSGALMEDFISFYYYIIPSGYH